MNQNTAAASKNCKMLRFDIIAITETGQLSNASY